MKRFNVWVTITYKAERIIEAENFKDAEELAASLAHDPEWKYTDQELEVDEVEEIS